ncbi:hypothetical protein BST81_17675 [Leptolyngbya sp. 'hensonii']|uniref:hypothetical protein n=1 Tax=Leptolyngbya sp. 'hensonii' TaxID=1922337 RepID=UPI00094FC3D8|nr:hypothetical protein [Leptolyngbya sp. 'hensonii']OLP17178.1 hypothetical protein BST81_17675 [Leptolyngbya sp. 'hensonii']
MSTTEPAKPSSRRSRPRTSQVTHGTETVDVSSTPVDPAVAVPAETPVEIETGQHPDAGEPIEVPYEPAPLPSLQMKESEPPVEKAGGLVAAPPAHLATTPLPGNRPITPSKLQFRYSRDLPHRPVAISPTPIRHSETLPGNRPVGPGALKEFYTGSLPGNRPIVPTNKSTETEEMIGYLD